MVIYLKLHKVLHETLLVCILGQHQVGLTLDLFQILESPVVLFLSRGTRTKLRKTSMGHNPKTCSRGDETKLW